METVQFFYSQSVWSPPFKAGPAGETRELPADVAVQLETEGYGHIVKERSSGNNSGSDTVGDDNS